MTHGREHFNGSVSADIDPWYDGLLDDDARDVFEQRLSVDPSLSVEVERQRRIDGSIRRRLSPPTAERIMEFAVRAQSDVIPIQASRSTGATRWFAVAAALAGCMLGALLIYRSLAVKSVDDGYNMPPMTIAQHYQAAVMSDFEGFWACDDEEVFAQTFRVRVGQPLLLGQLPEGVNALGLAKCNTITPASVCLAGTVGDDRIVVYIDQEQFDLREQAMVPDGLMVHKRNLGQLVLYEVSPREKPHFLEYFYSTDGTIIH